MIEGMSNENPGYKAFSRHAEGLVKMALADTPVVLIQGARQVGKSTLATQVLAGTGARLLTLDTHSVLSAAQNDPDSFVRQNPDSLLAIDEVQHGETIFLMTASFAVKDPGPEHQFELPTVVSPCCTARTIRVENDRPSRGRSTK